MQEKKTVKHHIRYFRVACALLTLGLLIGGAVFLASRNSKNKDKSSEESSSESTSINTSDVSVVYEKEPDELGELDELKTQIENKIADYPGEWSVYIKNLNTGDHFTINDKQIYPASMIKLFALGASYEQIEQGLITENEYYTYLYGMTVMSNNNSFNQMIWTIGRDYLTKWCHDKGYTRTYQYHGLSPSDNAAGLETSNKPNETCASDVGHMLEDIYNGKCVSKSASEKMLELLKQQHWVSKIPSGLPPMTPFANKTGDTTDYSHDAAIVYTDAADYIIVIMSENPGVASKQDHRFIELSRMTYEYFNGPVNIDTTTMTTTTAAE